MYQSVNTKAIFKDIQQCLEAAIRSSTDSIQVCVAWFTNQELLGLLTDKADKKVAVKIIVSDNFSNQLLSFKDFIRAGGTYLICPTKGVKERFLHEKFALFDNQQVVVGSYNWTYAAEHRNHESILSSVEPHLIEQYQWRFRKISEHAQPAPEIEWLPQSQHVDALAETQLQQLEEELKKEFTNTLNEADRLNITIKRQFVENYIERYGAIGAAKRLLSPSVDKVQSGFIKLCAANRQMLTFESIVLHPQYHEIFSDSLFDEAKRRLRSHS